VAKSDILGDCFNSDRWLRENYLSVYYFCALNLDYNNNFYYKAKDKTPTHEEINIGLYEEYKKVNERWGCKLKRIFGKNNYEENFNILFGKRKIREEEVVHSFGIDTGSGEGDFNEEFTNHISTLHGGVSYNG
tara:strand:- start:4468 stop:4866 length:399 start_codon:yes stop_codon:yes gene_type:complete